MAQSNPKRISLDEVIHLVKQLTAEQQEELRLHLKKDAAKGFSLPDRFMGYKIDLENLA